MSEGLSATKTASTLSLAGGVDKYPAVRIEGQPLINRAFPGGVVFLDPDTKVVIGALPPTDKVATIKVVEHVKKLEDGLRIVIPELVGVENLPCGGPCLVTEDFLRLFEAWSTEATWAGPNLDGLYTVKTRSILPSNGRLVQIVGGLVAARPLVLLSNPNPTRTRQAPCGDCKTGRGKAYAYAMGLDGLNLTI